MAGKSTPKQAPVQPVTATPDVTSHVASPSHEEHPVAEYYQQHPVYDQYAAYHAQQAQAQQMNQPSQNFHPPVAQPFPGHPQFSGTPPQQPGYATYQPSYQQAHQPSSFGHSPFGVGGSFGLPMGGLRESLAAAPSQIRKMNADVVTGQISLQFETELNSMRAELYNIRMERSSVTMSLRPTDRNSLTLGNAKSVAQVLPQLQALAKKEQDLFERYQCLSIAYAELTGGFSLPPIA